MNTKDSGDETENEVTNSHTSQKMTFFIKVFFSKCDQIDIFLRIWSHLLKKSLIENFNFCAVRNFELRNFFSQTTFTVASFPLVLDSMQKSYVILFQDAFHFLV